MTSDAATVGAPPAAAPADLSHALRQVPLFAGLSDEDLRDFASAFAAVELATDEVLWRQGTPVDGLHILLSGEARVTRRLPGEREIEVARLGPGSVMGEIPLLGGGTHSAGVRADSPCVLAFLHRRDFRARVQLGRPDALTVKRRIVEIACARVRSDHAAIGAALAGGEAAPGGGAPAPAAAGEAMRPPSHAYVSRLPFCALLGPRLTAALIERGETRRIPAGHLILEEGGTPGHLYITLNGAVEDVLRRGARSIRVRLAGPGRAFGYLGLIDGGPATATSVARERTVALALAAHDVQALREGGDDLSRAFAAALERDLMETLRSTASPMAHLTAAAG